MFGFFNRILLSSKIKSKELIGFSARLTISGKLNKKVFDRDLNRAVISRELQALTLDSEFQLITLEGYPRVKC